MPEGSSCPHAAGATAKPGPGAGPLAWQIRGSVRDARHPTLPPTPAERPQATHLVTASWASGLGGGTRKHTEGTVASLPQLLTTFQWNGCTGPTSWHSSPLCMVTWGSQSCQCGHIPTHPATPHPAMPLHVQALPSTSSPPPACSHTQPAVAHGPARVGLDYGASAAQWLWPAWQGLRGAPYTHSAGLSRPAGKGQLRDQHPAPRHVPGRRSVKTHMPTSCNEPHTGHPHPEIRGPSHCSAMGNGHLEVGHMTKAGPQGLTSNGSH